MPYLITLDTLAIIPGSENSIVIESDKELIVDETPLEILSRNCQLNGSTLEGRQKGSSYLTGSSYKPPILLNEINNLIFIPTHSIRNKECVWVSLNNILNYYPDGNKVEILFKSYQKVHINQSYSIFDKQVMRATRLESALRGRNSKKFL